MLNIAVEFVCHCFPCSVNTLTLQLEQSGSVGRTWDSQSIGTGFKSSCCLSNSFSAVIATWLRAFQRSRVGFEVNGYARE